MPISAIETLASNLERRGLRNGEARVFPRLCDLPTTLPAITGKVEMVYEGEQQGAEVIAKKLIGSVLKKLFDSKFPPPDSGRPTQRRREDVEEGLEDAGARRIRPAPEKIHPLYEPIVEWFANGGKVTISDDTPFPEHFAVLDGVPGLRKAVEERFAPASSEECAVGMELVLEGLTQHLKIAREDLRLEGLLHGNAQVQLGEEPDQLDGHGRRLPRAGAFGRSSPWLLPDLACSGSSRDTRAGEIRLHRPRRGARLLLHRVDRKHGPRVRWSPDAVHREGPVLPGGRSGPFAGRRRRGHPLSPAESPP